MINKKVFFVSILLLLLLYILKYEKIENIFIWIILGIFLSFFLKDKENFVNYPEIINEAIDTVKYGNINKKLTEQNKLYSPNSYQPNNDMYSLNHEDEACNPLNIPTSYYKK
tara:strand:- start:770 stop:1105 length:336 start_codon:yes stop_codon:yes gene_type:complete